MIIDSRYEVIKKLGSGVWATVYKVRCVRTDIIYALKLFNNLDSSEFYEKFSAEDMHQITKIQHPNLIHVSDFGNYGKNIYYLSEYFEGKTLNEFKFSKISTDVFYDIVVQISYALSALHSQGILHKDLKPTNVIYQIKNNKPQVKIMDYGFSKMGMEYENQKIDQNLPYIAPEAYNSENICEKSDYYSLGVILYKLTSGTLPYTSEQLSALVAGRKLNILPKFPREINPEISEQIEKLILRLIEKNSEDRFKSIENIITYINSIQSQNYSFSSKWSIINRIKFSDYFVRDDYSHKLLDYVPIISKGNGKIISLSAGKGLGKNNVLTLFKYHLLTNEQFIFDYRCDSKHKDPFFALIKEFSVAAKQNKERLESLENISSKMKEYLFDSEEKATKKVQNKKELELDFQSASNFIFNLSAEKPIIFIIRAVEHLPKEVFNFINFISRNIMNMPILIIISLNDPRKLEGMIHTVKVNIDILDYEKTEKFVTKLLKKTPPQEFIKKIWKRSNGNPLFIEKILIDLTKKRKIWQNEKFIFSFDLDKYLIPKNLIDDVYTRLAHINKQNYEYLQKLAWIKTKLSVKLIKSVLNIDDKSLFFLVNDCVNNEILRREDKYLLITFREARERLNKETSEDTKKNISRQVLKYFDNITIKEKVICKGIINHAKHAEDIVTTRKFNLTLAKILKLEGEHQAAFLELCNVIELDILQNAEISETELKKDLKLFMDFCEWFADDYISSRIKKSIRKLGDISEKHLLLGKYYDLFGKFNLAKSRFQRAYELSLTGKIKIQAILRLCSVELSQNRFLQVEKYIKELDNYNLQDEDLVEYIAFKGLLLGNAGEIDEGIALIENFIPKMETKNSSIYLLRVGTLHNNLANLYHQKKLFDEADKNFKITKGIWESQKYYRKLGMIYNNIGDVALVKGDTKTAFENFKKAIDICNKAMCRKVKVQSLLNYGEAYIKMGNFVKAESYLNDAETLSQKVETNPFHKSIINNLAIAKSKVNNFAYYYDFIKEHTPELLDDKIKSVNPLIKTYFYYLYKIGDYKKIKLLLEKYENLFLEKKEHEFFFQMLGFYYIGNQEYLKAKQTIEKAFKYSKQNKSDYAQAIIYIRFLACSLGLGDIKESYEICKKAEILCEKNDFSYWKTVLKINKVKVKMLDNKVNLRYLVRELLDVLNFVKKENLFISEMKVYSLLIQIYSHLNLKDEAVNYFKEYKIAIRKSIKGLPEKDASIFKKKMDYQLKNYSNLKTIEIRGYEVLESDNWQEELFDILKLQDNERMKFFINRMINKLFAPHYYCLLLKEKNSKKNKIFLHHNLDYSLLNLALFKKNISKCIEKNRVITRKIKNNNVNFIPLRIKYSKVGCLIISDKGEYPMQKVEREIIKVLRLHLTSILIRMDEFSQLNKNMVLMTNLVEITRKFFRIFDKDRLEQEVMSFVVNFTSASRGFFIIKDENENYKYKVALDESDNMLKNYSHISKAILSEVQQLKEPIFIKNALKEGFFESYFTQKEEKLSIYCAPIVIEKKIYGYIYLDDYDSSKVLDINLDFLQLILTQISVAVKNALQYQELENKNKEISSFDNMKKDFINIVSHELKTPMMSLKGNMRLLEKKKKTKPVIEMGQNIDKLYSLFNDLINFNKYQMVKKLDKTVINTTDLFTNIKNDVEILSAERHMQFKLEIDENASYLNCDWNATQILLTNIVLNAIRFTKDFGTIVLGARISTFQIEKIDGKDSIVLYVQDNGIGIPENQHTKIFKEFYELSDIISHSSGTIEFKSSGLGLGLSTAKQIANLQGGKIWINSKENEGTTVFIALPII